MRIAIISDIHANLPALEQVLKSIQEQDIDAVYCLGDLVGYNVWPNAVINEIRKRGIVTIAGNHDEKAIEIYRENTIDDESNFAYDIIGGEQILYLATLPAHIWVDYKINRQSFKIMMVHGSPYSNTEYLTEDRKETEFSEMFLNTGADIIICGHSHKPYHRVISNEMTGKKHHHIINAGSVGKPKDGNPQCCYAILTINKNSSIYNAKTIGVEFIRVDYDIEKAAKAIEDSVLPDDFADRLRKAY